MPMELVVYSLLCSGLRAGAARATGDIKIDCHDRMMDCSCPAKG